MPDGVGEVLGCRGLGDIAARTVQDRLPYPAPTGERTHQNAGHTTFGERCYHSLGLGICRAQSHVDERDIEVLTGFHMRQQLRCRRSRPGHLDFRMIHQQRCHTGCDQELIVENGNVDGVHHGFRLPQIAAKQHILSTIAATCVAIDWLHGYFECEWVTLTDICGQGLSSELVTTPD